MYLLKDLSIGPLLNKKILKILKISTLLKTRMTLFRTPVIGVRTIATGKRDGTQLEIPGLGSIVPIT